MADFQWFGTLGFPDVSGCPVARVATGGWGREGDQPVYDVFIDGFLLRHDEQGKFSVLTPQLFVLDCQTSPATEDRHRVGYEERPLAQVADDYLAELAKESSDPEARMRKHFGERLSQQAQVFVWAWACWRNGLEDQAVRLYEQAVTGLPYHGDKRELPSLRARLTKDLGYAMLWRATLDFGDPAIPRARLLATFETVVKNYPGTEYAEQARKTADALKKMVAEDAAHAATAITPLDELSSEQRVKELVFRLRDQNGKQLSQPGSCDVFFDDDFADMAPTGTTPSVAAQLVALGDVAVPALIEALDNETFSRSVGYWRDFKFSHHVLTVGDCAEQVLERIAGRQFFQARTTSSYMSKDAQTKEVKAEVEAWWKVRQTRTSGSR